MSEHLKAAIARIFLDGEDIPIGVGFLTSEKYILTCAHVVAQAIGIPSDTLEMPTNKIRLDFPLAALGQIFAARVIHWQPVQPTASMSREDVEDIAILELENIVPETVQSLKLVTVDDLWGHPFRAFGFPNGYDKGVWASGVLRDNQVGGFIQIEDVKVPGHSVIQGFSGTPVLDEQLDGVVGMVVEADRQVSAKVASIIPTPLLVKSWPDLAQQIIPPCPYRGLHAFQEQDTPYFFGRNEFTDKLIEGIRRQSRMVVIIGPSGSGKSSVVFAGLYPRLCEDQNWLLARFRTGSSRNPFQALASTLQPLLEPQMSEAERLKEIQKLAYYLDQGDFGLYELMVRIVQKSQIDSRILIVADQFEELFTHCLETDTRNHFLDMLLKAVEFQRQQQCSLFTLAFTLRADFMGQVATYRPLADAFQGSLYILGPMKLKELNEAIEEPAKKQGVTFESGLIKRILDDVGNEPGNLPLLEFALTLLWKEQKNGRLTHDAYEAIGTVEGALANYADQTLDALDLPENEKERVRQVFVQMVTPGEGTEDTRRVATRADFSDDDWVLIQQLSNARLVVTNVNANGQETAEVVHEALIQRWGQFKQWINADRAFRAWQERLRSALRQWQKSNQDDGALLRGAPLAEAKQWLDIRGRELNAKEREYLFHSFLDESVDLNVEMPQYWTIEEILVYIDQYKDATDEAKHIKSIDALRWSPFSDREDEVFDRLKRYVLHDVLPVIRNKAAQYICEREHISRLTNLLSSRELHRHEKQRLIQALASVRNLSKIGFELEKVLQHSKRLVLLGALLRIIKDYRNQFAIILFFSYLSGQLTLLFLGQLANSIQLFTSSNFYVDYTSGTLDIFSVVVVLSFGLYRIIRIEIIDQQKIMILQAISCAWIFIFTFDALVAIYTILNNNVIDIINHKHVGIVATTANIFFLFLPDILGLSIITLAFRVNFKGQRVIWKLLWISIFGAGIQSLLQVFLYPIILELTNKTSFFSSTSISYDSAVILTSVYNNLDNVSSVFATLIANILSVFGCLLGFLFGFRSAFLDKNENILTSLNLSYGRNNKKFSIGSSQAHTSIKFPSSKALRVFNIKAKPNVKLRVSNRSLWLRKYILLFIVLLALLGLSISGIFTLTKALPKSLYSYHIGGFDRNSNSKRSNWSSDGQRFTLISKDSSVEVWDAASGKRLYIYRGHLGNAQHVTWSPDGKYLAARFSYDDSNGNPHEQIEAWDAASGETLYVYRSPSKGVSNEAWSPAGQLLAATSDDGAVEVWNATSGKRLYIYRGHLGNAQNVIWSPDGKYLATRFGYYDNNGTSFSQIEAWDAASGKTLYVYRSPSKGVSNEAWSPAGQLLAATSDDGAVEVWNATSGKRLYIYRGHLGDAQNVIWSPDGKYLAASFEHDDSNGNPLARELDVWDVTSRKPLYIYPISSNVSNDIYVWSPDGKYLAIADDTTVEVLDLASRKPLYTSYSQSNSIYSVEWSPNSKYLASANNGGILQIWDAATGGNVFALYNFPAQVNLWRLIIDGSHEVPSFISISSIEWSSDSKRIISIDEDGSTQIWKVM